MARRRTLSRAEDLMDLMAQMPWWAGVVLALVSHAMLRFAVDRTAPWAAAEPGQMAAPAAVWHGLAWSGQYLVPLACLCGAAVSALLRRSRRRPLQDRAVGAAPAAPQPMSRQAFESLVAEAFRRRGYAVQAMAAGLLLSKGQDQSLVQCRHWRATQVGAPALRQLHALMATHSANGGFVVTFGRFTQEAVAFASGRNIRLIDGTALEQLVKECQSLNPAPPAGHARAPVAAAAAQLRQRTPGAAHKAMAPRCPECGKTMVRRMTRRSGGGGAGTDFWGCSAHPECLGSREVERAGGRRHAAAMPRSHESAVETTPGQ